MRISEWRQELERPAPLSDQRLKEMPGSWWTPATVIPPDCNDESRTSLSGQCDATNPGKLVHAVCNGTELEESASDELLLKSVAEGDKAAMHIMYARHRIGVFRFILRMVRNADIADDLVSQVFLDVWRSANRFESRARVSTWLLAIARLRALSSLRAQKRRFEAIDRDDVADIADASDTPDVDIDRRRTNVILRACIDKLSPAHREIVDLVYYHEKSVTEASEIVGIPCATVKSRMFYARKHLAKMLVSAGFEATAIRPNLDAGDARSSRGMLLTLRAGASAN